MITGAPFESPDQLPEILNAIMLLVAPTAVGVAVVVNAVPTPG